MLAAPLYWDWNATTPCHADVLAAVAKAQGEAWANPASPHALGRRAKAVVEEARELVGAALSVSPRDVLFTASGTEANNLALRDASAIVTSRLEHPSVVRCAELAADSGVAVRWLAVPQSGELEPEGVEAALRELPASVCERAVVAVAAANHETGVVQPIEAISERCAARSVRLHVDAAQSLGKLALGSLPGVVSIAIAGHKIRAPKGVAALAWRGPYVPTPLLVGGSQQRGLRPSTVSAPLVAGLGAAVRRISPGRYQRLAAHRDALERELGRLVVVNGAGGPRLPHVSSLSALGWTGERLVAALDVAGLCVSTGSACSVGTQQPSASVEAMLGEERARSAIRISLGEDTTAAEVAAGVAILQRVLRRRRPSEPPRSDA